MVKSSSQNKYEHNVKIIKNFTVSKIFWKQVSLYFMGLFHKVLAHVLQELLYSIQPTEGIWNLGHGCVSERCGLSNIVCKIYEFQAFKLKVKDESFLLKQAISLR